MSAAQLSAWPGRLIPLLGAGLISQGPPPGGAMLESASGILIVAALLGGFCGLIFGLVTAQLLRYISFLMGRHLSAASWAVFTMVVGAIVFAWLSVARHE